MSDGSVKMKMPELKSSFWMILSGVLGVLALGFLVGLLIVNGKLQNAKAELALSQQDNLVMQKQMERERGQYEETLALLSSQVASNIVKNEADEAKKMPTTLPVVGKAVIEEEPGNDANQAEPVIVFQLDKNTQMVAAGAGVVEGVFTDSKYGYKVVIDHGNGYKSIYFGKGSPKVKESAEVIPGTLIYEITSKNSKCAFQITLDGVFVDPMTLLQING